MNELPFILLVFLVAVAIITLVGHGIWVVLAAILGGGKQPRRKCVFCERPTSCTAQRCEWCGRDLRSLTAAEMADLAAVERQLRRFRENHALKPETVDNLMTRLHAYRQRLAAPRATSREPPVVAEVVPDVRPVVPAASPPTLTPPASEPMARPKTTEPAKPRWIAPAAQPLRTPAIAHPQAAAFVKPQPVPPAAPKSAPAPRRSWSEMLAGFMEERNIRWGELVGGLLFVCSTVALVVSLWDRLEKIRYFPFFIFVAISSAVFGIGLYAHHRWKLQSTSRGMLIIATLLVPLNFVAMAGPTKDDWTMLALLAELISLGIFTWLVSLAARVLVPSARWLAVLAVIGNSAAVLLVARVIGPDSPAWIHVGVGALPVGLFAAAVAGHLGRTDRSQLGMLRGAHCQAGDLRPANQPTRQLDLAQIGTLFILLGITAFSMAVAMGLLVAQAVRTPFVSIVVSRLSVLLSIAAMPAIAAGLAVMRGTRRDKSLGPYHLAGTMLALVGVAAMLAAVGLAWPRPGWLIAASVLDAAALAFAAFRWRVPALHAGAIAAAALAYLAAFHWLVGDTTVVSSGTQMLEQMISARSGTALAGLFLVLAAVSELLARQGLRRHGLIYMGGAAVAAVVGLQLVTFYGIWNIQRPEDTLRAAILYAVYGAGSLGLVARWRRVELSYLGLALLAIAPFWAMWWHPATRHVGPPWAAVLAIESLLMAALAVLLGRAASGPWDDLWKRVALWFDEDADATTNIAKTRPVRSPRFALARSAPILDLYRMPLAHLAELVAMIGVVATLATAWLDRVAIDWSPVPVLTVTCLAAVCFVLAWPYRSPARTWIGSLVALAGVVHTLNFNYTGAVQPWLMALLLHSTAALAAGLLLDARAPTLRRVIGQPLTDSALVSSLLVVPAAMFGPWTGAVSLACCLFWLAAIWLVLAWRRREAVLFAAHQTALTAAVFAGTTAWLQHVGRITDFSQDCVEPGNLQVYGIALGLLSLVWIAARIGTGKLSSELRELIDRWPSVDWIVRNGLIAAESVLVAVCLVPEVLRELVGRAVVPAAFDGSAWMLLAVLAAVFLAALWERWREAELAAIILLVAVAAGLTASRFAADLAVASALRWSLALGFVACSVVIWQRDRVLGWCRLASTRVELGTAGPRIARGVLLAVTALPALGLTLLAAALQLGGARPAGPAAATFFRDLGPTWSYLVPLALVMAGMVGFALRERSSGYAFSAGLVLEMAVTLGYALHAATFDVAFRVTLLQLATIAAGAWAIVWLVARNWVDVWREAAGSAGVLPARASKPLTPHAPAGGTPARQSSPTVLMNVQIGMAVAGNMVLIGCALATLVFVPVSWNQEWSIAAGLPLGWIALALPLAASQLRGRLRPHAVGLFGMAALGLLACAVRGLGTYWGLAVEAEWGYRTLMLGWAIYALLVVLATWWVASLRTLPDAQGPPQTLVRMAAAWVRIAASAAVLLGLKTAFWDTVILGTSEQLWAAAAIAVASAAGATMAVWRRREGWAFSAALGVNLAASLAVWHFHGQLTFHEWWVRLLQANVIASAAVALVWSAARKRLYELRDLTLGESPLLAVQTTLPVAGNLVLLLLPVVWLVHTPGWLPAWMAELAAPAGWIGLLLTAAASAWYVRHAIPGNLLHVLAGTLLGLGTLAACSAAPLDQPFRAYHVLLVGWAIAAMAVLSAGIATRKLAWFRASPVQPWLAFIGALVVFFAVLHSWQDPGQPWWSAGVVLAMSVAFGVVALWLRHAVSVYVSGLLINVAGILAWWAWRPAGADALTALVQTNVLCLAIGSAVWSLLDRARQAFHSDSSRTIPSGGGQPFARLEGPTYQLPYAHFAAVGGTLVVGLVVTLGVAAHLCDLPQHAGVDRLDWIALAAIAAAVATCLLDRAARFPVPSLYSLALTAVGTGLWARELSPRAFFWSAANELSGFVLAAAVLGWLLASPSRRRSSGGQETTNGWFAPTQAALAVLAAALGTWVTLDFAFDGVGYPLAPFATIGRMAGAGAILVTLFAAIVMSAGARARWRDTWQGVAFGLGVLFLSGAGWALLHSDVAVLHRSVVLMVAATATMLLTGFGLTVVMPSGSDWIDRGRQSVPALAGLAALSLAAVLAQEAYRFHSSLDVPLAAWEIAVVAGGMLSMAAACIAFAVVPEWDPLKQSDRQRQVYVYLAEAIALLIGFHVRFTMPWIFRGYFQHYWMFVVMAVAFLGAGLSEWFHRRKLPVLAQPLERTCLIVPLVPALGFWLMPAPDGPWSLADRTPLMWLFMGLFYTVMAVTRRSVLCSVLAVLTANLGLWVLLYDHDVRFLHHPQFWLVPLALAGLVAEYLNRDRLNEAQRGAFRYLALGVIYISSTFDMYIDWGLRLGWEWQLPLVLMVLSVTGALAGILLRVRSFLYLGVIFLTVDLLSMIWHTAVDHPWIWYASGIALGAAIIALFAVFEKRRNDVLAAVERLKEWRQ
jgi:hypothetical protein